MGEIFTVLSGIGQKGVIDRLRTGKGGIRVRIYMNEKEVLTLLDAMKLLVSTTSDKTEAKELLEKIEFCIELQCKFKANS
jgi:hypothetical protein